MIRHLTREKIHDLKKLCPRKKNLPEKILKILPEKKKQPEKKSQKVTEKSSNCPRKNEKKCPRKVQTAREKNEKISKNWFLGHFSFSRGKKKHWIL